MEIQTPGWYKFLDGNTDALGVQGGEYGSWKISMEYAELFRPNHPHPNKQTDRDTQTDIDGE